MVVDESLYGLGTRVSSPVEAKAPGGLVGTATNATKPNSNGDPDKKLVAQTSPWPARVSGQVPKTHVCRQRN